MLKKLVKNDFLKSVSILMTGTILSQFINLAFTPVLSRIYSVEEMADLNLFFRITSFILGFATLRYEMSLPLPKNDTHSFLLYRASIRIATYALVLTGVFGFIYLLTQDFHWQQLWFLVFVILGTAFSVMINLGTNWAIRKNKFNQITFSRISNVFSSNVLRVVFGFFQWGTFGLLLGTVLGYALSSLQFIKEYLKHKVKFKSVFSQKKQRVLILEHKQFPLINLPQNLVDLARDLLMASLIVLYFGKEVFGHYSYSILILNIPITIIASAISQVFYNKAVNLIHEGRNLFPLVKNTMLILLLMAIVPFSILYFFSEELFVIVFGEKWRMAGVYSKILVFYNFFVFLVVPFSNLPLVLKKQKAFFISAIINSSGQVALIFYGAFVLKQSNEGFISVLWLLTIFQSMMMLCNIAMIFYFSKRSVQNG